MDPFSIAVGTLSIIDVALRTTSALIRYGRDTQHSSRDKRLLMEETSFLSKLLERLKQRSQANQNQKWLEDHRSIVEQFTKALQDLAETLKFDLETGEPKVESRLRAMRSAAKWTFTKSEVFTLLQRVERLQQYANALLSDDQHTILERLGQKQQEAFDQEMKSSLLQWLSPLQMVQIHQTISDRAERGSGQWFLTLECFLKWYGGEYKQLWCWGIPGAGKTVLVSIIVNHLRHQRDEEREARIGIAVIYFKYNDPDQTLDNILGSLIRQLVNESSVIPTQLVKFYEQSRNRDTSLSVDELGDVLKATVDEFDEVYFVVDGLDECSEELRWELMEQLEKCQPQLHLLITSRYLDAISEELADFKRYEIKANRADIELFIDRQIQKNRNLRRLVQRNHALREDIKDSVLRTAEHMFLLAQLHVESLASAAGLSVKHVRQKLKTLPNTLAESYSNAVQRIEDQEPDHKRLKELQHALAIEPGDTKLDEELIMDGQNITMLCAGLVVVDQGTNMVNLVHYSTKNFFEKSRQAYFPDFHANITMSCATYLTLDALKSISIASIVRDYPLACYAAQFIGDHARQTPEEALEPSVLETICLLLSHPDKRRPLLSLLDGLDLIRSGFYSTSAAEEKTESALESSEAQIREMFSTGMEISEKSLETPTLDGYQARQRGNDNGRPSLSSDFSYSSTTSTILETEDEEHSPPRQADLWEAKIKTSRIPEVTALHLAASMGLAKVASMLLKETPNIDAVDETGKTALIVAMERGFEKAVEFLVNSGACVDLRHEHGCSVLLLVLERNWRSAAEVIAKKSRSALQEDDPEILKQQLRFILAAYDGDLAEISRLASLPTLELQGRDRKVTETALFLAVEQESLRMIRTLIGIGVDVDAKDAIGQTALFRAARRQHEPTVKLLLEMGCKIDCKDDEGRTAWSANLRTFNKNILNILLKAGADPSIRGLQGVSELYSAAKDGETALVRLMLESGTNPSIQTVYDWAPLHWAASYGHIECVKLLLAAGADASVKSDQGVTPLDLAIQSEQFAIVEILKMAGAKRADEAVNDTSLVDTLTESDVYSLDTIVPPPGKDEILDSKLFLVFDKPLIRTLTRKWSFGQFAYPREQEDCPVPNGYIYQVSHAMETTTDVINVRLAQRRAGMKDYPLDPGRFQYNNSLYEIQRLGQVYQEFRIRPRDQSLLTGPLRMHKDWTGSWKIQHEDEDSQSYLFRTTPEWSTMSEQECRWITDEGKVLARTGWDDATPNLCFEPGLDRQTIDLVVSCWTVKLWVETAALLRQGT